MNNKYSFSYKKFWLEIVTRKLLEMLEVVYAGGVMIPDRGINLCYMTLLDRAEEVLQEEGFEGLRTSFPNFPENIIGNFQIIEFQLDSFKNEFLNFLSKLDQRSSGARKETSKVDNNTARVLKLIDKSIDNYKGLVKKRSEALDLKIEAARIKYLEYLSNQKNTYKDNHSISLPPGTRWEAITIKFKTGEDVLIKIGKQKAFLCNFAVMGFQDKRNCKPVFQWTILKILSEHGGEIAWDNPKIPTKVKDQIMKQKQLLTDKLQFFFGIDSDPFYDYKRERLYKTRFVIITRLEQLVDEEDIDDPMGIQESWKEQTPEVYTADDFPNR